MKKDELRKLKNKSLSELTEKIIELKKEIAVKKLEREAGKSKNVREITNLKKNLAQLLTIFRLKELTVASVDKNSQNKREEQL